MSCEWQSVVAIMSGNKLQGKPGVVYSVWSKHSDRQTVDGLLAQAQRLCFQVSGDHPAAISKYWFS